MNRSKNKLTVVVKEEHGKFFTKKKRFNFVSPRIIKFLVKHHFSFKFAISPENVVNSERAKNYLEIFMKREFIIGTPNSAKNAMDNYHLLKKLGDKNASIPGWVELMQQGRW